MMKSKVSLKDIRKGTLFWECERGDDELFVATTNPETEEDCIFVYGRSVFNGETHRFLENTKHPAYAPKLYTFPQYNCLGWSDWWLLLEKCATLMQEEIAYRDSIIEWLEVSEATELLEKVRRGEVDKLHDLLGYWKA